MRSAAPRFCSGLLFLAIAQFVFVSAAAAEEPAAKQASPQPGEKPATQPLANQPRTVVVNVLVVSKSGDGGETGFCTPVSVTAGGAQGNKVRVGFFETEAGGTGDSWRSAGWTAAITAALLSDFDPRAMHVSFEYEGKVDGPSAGR